MICFNSVPVDNGLVRCGSSPARETVDNGVLPEQVSPACNDNKHIGFFCLSTVSTGSSTTTMFFFNSSKN
jgi:hypothetical protein